MDNLIFKELLRSFPNCFTNLSQNFQTVKFFLNFFLKIRDLYLNRCPSQIFYKYMVTFSIYQIYLYFFLDLTFRVSFITCRCQIFYKCKDKYLIEQVKSYFFKKTLKGHLLNFHSYIAPPSLPC